METEDFNNKTEWLTKNTPYKRLCDLVVIDNRVYMAHGLGRRVGVNALIKVTLQGNACAEYINVNKIEKFTNRGYVLSSEANELFNEIGCKSKICDALTYRDINTIKVSMLESLYESEAQLDNRMLLVFKSMYNSVKTYNEILILDEYPQWMT